MLDYSRKFEAASYLQQTWSQGIVARPTMGKKSVHKAVAWVWVFFEQLIMLSLSLKNGSSPCLGELEIMSRQC